MKSADVVIAGAGVAGCLAARDLARKGYGVVVLEKGSRELLGHDWWDTLETNIFDTVDIPAPGPQELKGSFTFDIHTPLGPTGVTTVMPPSRVNIDRAILARRLVKYAEEAGAEIRFNSPAISPVLEDGSVAGARAAAPDGSEYEIPASLTLDATGHAGALRSRLPKNWGIETRLRREDFVTCYREIREDTTGGAGKSILIIGDGPGAQWVARNEPGFVDVLACVMDGRGRRDPREMVTELAARDGGVGEKVVRGGYSERIPVRRGLDCFTAPGFMIAGDSASMANPLNGSGVSTALHAASMAAKTADRAFRRGRFDAETLWPYNVEYKRTRDGKFAKLYMFQKFVSSEPVENFHLMLERNIMPSANTWEMEDGMSPAAGLGALPRLFSLAERPDFLARLLFTFHLVFRLEEHYGNFPRSYHPRAFRRWVRRTRRLLRMAPGGR